MYIKQSDHPPSILKNIPMSVNTRLCSISANEDVFNQACPIYQDALDKSGYDFKLKFNPPRQNENKFNPPFSKNGQSNKQEHCRGEQDEVCHVGSRNKIFKFSFLEFEQESRKIFSNFPYQVKNQEF